MTLARASMARIGADNGAAVRDAARKWVSGEDRRVAPSAAKLFCTEMAGQVADLAVQIHGGTGYMREVDGRSYAAAPVALTCLRIGALDLAVAQAVSAGATGLEAAAVVTVADNPIVSVASVREVGGEGVAVYVANPQGDVVQVLTT